MAFFQTQNLRVEKDDTGAQLLLDVAGRSVNVFNRQVLTELGDALDRIAAEPGLQLLVVQSADLTKFIAGADLQEFATIKSSEEAKELSALGQSVFSRLASLPMPTVAIVCGPSLGGGLELALACDYRLAIDHPKIQFGLPEVELGIIPGWGGTQRLPRVVGLERALQVILGGRRLNAAEAQRWGLVDVVAPWGGDFREQWMRLAEIARQGKRNKGKLPLRTWRQRFLESTSPGRSLIFRAAERVLRKRIPDDMPAPREALEAVRVGLTRGREAGLAHEREANARLARTPACRNLVGLFFQREKARKVPEGSASAIRKVGVVGAGTMGAGIAQLAAIKGAQVVVQEINDDALGAGLLKITELFQKAVERRLLTQQEAQDKLEVLRGTTAWEGFADADLVIEAALEDLGAKQAIFHELEKRTRPTAILATNTSSLLVKDLQRGLAHPERVAGLHFFNPVHKMPLVEVVQGPATSDAVVAALLHWSAALGKTPVPVRDGPGFVVNRVLMPYLNEAVTLVAEGLPIEEVDWVMKRFGMPMGPLELLDQIGLDVAAHVARAMKPAAGSRGAHPGFAKMYERKWLGQKAGVGFYRYRGGKKKSNEEARDLLAASGPVPNTDDARDRMVLLMCNEAAACLGEGLAAGPEVIDLAMVMGTGWAPHRGGPLRYAQDRGIAEVVRRLTELAGQFGPRFEPIPSLKQDALV